MEALEHIKQCKSYGDILLLWSPEYWKALDDIHIIGMKRAAA